MASSPVSLENWSNFYVIVGSAAAGLTGLTFVVIALIADVQPVRLPGLRAFITPTILHFSIVLALAALLNVPGQSAASVSLCLAGSGLIGALYTAGTIRQLRRQRPLYIPVAADWVWNALLPAGCYLALLLAGTLLRAELRAALYAAAAVSLLLLFIGIHNAWDIAVWFTAEGSGHQRRRATGRSRSEE